MQAHFIFLLSEREERGKKREVARGNEARKGETKPAEMHNGPQDKTLAALGLASSDGQRQALPGRNPMMIALSL